MSAVKSKAKSKAVFLSSGSRSLYSIIKSSLITEKSTKDLSSRRYAFRVDLKANKIQIREAIEKIYKVKVAGVSSSIIKGKTKRIRANQTGKTTNWKKAHVTLREGFEIKLT